MKCLIRRFSMSIYLRPPMAIIALMLICSCSHRASEFKLAHRINTIEAYQSHIREYPNDTRAHYEIAKLKASTEAFLSFIEKFPESRLVDDAHFEIAKLNAGQKDAEGQAKIYWAFTKEHPDSRFKNEAYKILKPLLIIVSAEETGDLKPLLMLRFTDLPYASGPTWQAISNVIKKQWIQLPKRESDFLIQKLKGLRDSREPLHAALITFTSGEDSGQFTDYIYDGVRDMLFFASGMMNGNTYGSMCYYEGAFYRMAREGELGSQLEEAKTHEVEGSALLRFNGIYRSEEKVQFPKTGENCEWLRFYKDGTVIAARVNSDVGSMYRFLDRDKKRNWHLYGHYKSDGKQLAFTAIGEQLTHAVFDERPIVEYEGTILDDALDLELYQPDRGGRRQVRFRFFQLGESPPVSPVEDPVAEYNAAEGTVYFSKLRGFHVLRVFSLSGDAVAMIDLDGTTEQYWWRVTGDGGEGLPHGMYLYTAEGVDGVDKRVGKIEIVQ